MLEHVTPTRVALERAGVSGVQVHYLPPGEESCCLERWSCDLDSWSDAPRPGAPRLQLLLLPAASIDTTRRARQAGSQAASEGVWTSHSLDDSPFP